MKATVEGSLRIGERVYIDQQTGRVLASLPPRSRKQITPAGSSSHSLLQIQSVGPPVRSQQHRVTERIWKPTPSTSRLRKIGSGKNTGQNGSQSLLLQLPLEIRHMIYDLLLPTIYILVTYQPYTNNRVQRNSQQYREFVKGGIVYNRYDEMTGLRLANRQIYQETRSLGTWPLIFAFPNAWVMKRFVKSSGQAPRRAIKSIYFPRPEDAAAVPVSTLKLFLGLKSVTILSQQLRNNNASVDEAVCSSDPRMQFLQETCRKLSGKKRNVTLQRGQLDEDIKHFFRSRSGYEFHSMWK